MVTQDPAGDERDHARSVARHCGMALTEIVRDPAMVDLTRSEASGLPYPTETSFSQATRAAVGELIGSSARRIVHGGGGDQIFCSLQSAAPLADLIQARGFDRRIPALTLDLARLAHTTAGAVARQALARVIARRSDYRWPANLECLTPMARALEAQALQHPWLCPPAGTGSGSAGHVALTMSALGIVQSPAWRAHPPWKAILLSQPVIETCLSIPSWLWFERGRNRAIARHAVDNLLPAGHAWRPGKGAMASFMIEIFDANRSRLRAMIADGMLVRQGLVDREACLKILDTPPPIRGNAWARLLHFADVEAWAASW
jgi:asparagine synthase (glutamine-hydrolysing)